MYASHTKPQQHSFIQLMNAVCWWDCPPSKEIQIHSWQQHAIIRGRSEVGANMTNHHRCNEAFHSTHNVAIQKQWQLPPKKCSHSAVKYNLVMTLEALLCHYCECPVRKASFSHCPVQTGFQKGTSAINVHYRQCTCCGSQKPWTS